VAISSDLGTEFFLRRVLVKQEMEIAAPFDTPTIKLLALRMLNFLLSEQRLNGVASIGTTPTPGFKFWRGIK
jgi:hypothetical protein